MLQARPLYDTDADARLFVEPPEWHRILTGVDHWFNLALLGDRGSGKTTVLRQVQRALRKRGAAVVFVDATAVTDVEQLVDLVDQALRSQAQALDPATGLPPIGSRSVRLVERVRAWRDLPPTRILVDASHAASAAHALFGRLRDELWQLEHRWLVATERSERSTFLAPPADAFFDQILVLDDAGNPAFLTRVLDERPGGVLEQDVMRIARAARTPREALQALRDALVDDSPGALDARFARQEAAAALGRPHSMLMAELEELGGASASDEELLTRLGWSRARASQVLGELAKEGLVSASDERPPEGGRPRRVYRPRNPE